MAAKKRYVQVGVGGRARFWYEGLVGTYADSCELTGFCDVNRTRMEYAVKILQEKMEERVQLFEEFHLHFMKKMNLLENI